MTVRPAASSEHPVEPTHGLGQTEFVVLMAMVSATIAMSIDTLLPAFDEIETAFSLGGSGAGGLSISWTVTIFLIGLGVGTIVYGPLADRFGRKPMIYVSLAIFVLGAALSTLAGSYDMFLIGRVIWGFGAAGQRSLSLAIIRDSYSGDVMARIMSFTSAVFLVVPVLAPALGSVLLAVGSWRWTTGAACVLGLVVAIWFTRMNETLDEANRLPLEPRRVGRAARQVVTTRTTLLFTVAATMTYGAFFPWLGSSITMIEGIYGRDDPGQFARWFGLNAVLMMVSILSGERLVNRFGSYRVLLVQSVLSVLAAVAYVVVALAADGVPDFLVWFALASLLTGLGAAAAPLMQTLAMEPMGAIAGTAASVTGVALFAVGALLGWVIDRQINDTVTAFGVGFLAYGVIGLVAVVTAGSGRPAVPVDQAT